MNVEFIYTIVSAAIAVIGIIYSIIATIKNSKKSKTNSLAHIYHQLPEIIKTAEELVQGDGQGLAKLNYVLNTVHMKCIESGLSFNEDDWSAEIENILSTPEKKEN